jgi:hypothetical protein
MLEFHQLKPSNDMQTTMNAFPALTKKYMPYPYYPFYFDILDKQQAGGGRLRLPIVSICT